MKQWIFVLVWAMGMIGTIAQAQSLRVSTVTRPPFSMEIEGKDTGFSIELMSAIAARMDQPISITRYDNFTKMLDAVKAGKSDAAIANISITSAREAVIDFSHPIFSSGLQILVPEQDHKSGSLLKTIFSPDLLLALIVAFALLFAGGMLMWRFERRVQPYFEGSAREAMFPAFWWALNLVMNGGFEERVPRTPLGRILGVMLVVSSLFVVSIFVARITSAMTIEAITSSVNSVNDLYGKRVGTIGNSTASAFLDGRDLRHRTYGDLDELFAGFEAGDLEAIVFDAPILAYYANSKNNQKAQLVGPTFLPESYGIALPSGSDLGEQMNLVLLSLREDGTYDEIYRKWFGVMQ